MRVGWVEERNPPFLIFHLVEFTSGSSNENRNAALSNLSVSTLQVETLPGATSALGDTRSVSSKRSKSSDSDMLFDMALQSGVSSLFDMFKPPVSIKTQANGLTMFTPS